MTKKERFEALLQQVEIKFGRGISSEWKNRDFEDLNFEINKKTKTVISALTLKRIFGKIKTTDDYIPQKATMKALEQYANFELKNTPNLDAKINPNEHSTFEPEIKAKSPKKKTGLFLFICLIILVSGTLLYFVSKQENNSNVPGKLTLIKTEGFNPKTAHFEYTTPNNTDSFKISFDEEYKAIYIPNGKKPTSYFFQAPGLYKVKMLCDKTIVSDTIPILVETKGWQALAYYFNQPYKERLFTIPFKKSKQVDCFHPSTVELNAAGIDTSKIVVIRVDNFRPTAVDGDNFALNTVVKNTNISSGVRCNSIFLHIVGRNGAIQMRFTNPGCSYWINCKLSEKTINTNDEDLSNFVFDISEWQNIRLENKNKHIALFINKVKRFTNSYNKGLGEIVGVSVIFHGSGYLKDYLLTDSRNNVVFNF